MVVLAIIPLAMLTATPTVQLFNPPPGQYDIEQLWKARVSNLDNTTYEAWFEGFVFEATQGQVFYARTKKFQLPPGTRIYMYRDVQIERTQSAPGYERFATQIGGLPAGSYTFVLVLNAFGISDTVEFEVRPMGPPRLVRPRDGDTVRAPYPQFVWTPPRPASPGVTYDLKLVQLLEGQSPDEALRANLPWFDQADLRVPSLTYPTSARALEEWKTYAWQVAARDASGAPATSETRAFTLLKGGASSQPKCVTVLATIVWQHVLKGSSDWEIWYADYVAGMNSVTAPQQLYASLSPNMDPAVACDRSGYTWVVWSHLDPGANQYEILWSRRPGLNVWSAAQPIAAPTNGNSQVDPVIAFDDNGKGFCVWVEGQISPTSDVTYLQCAFWNGTSWSAPNPLGPANPCRLPEITFTSAPASPQTNHQAVVIAALQTPADKIGYWIWDGSAWSQCTALPTTGGVVANPYTWYFNPSGAHPTFDHLTISALKYPSQIVTAAWTRQTPAASTKLMACNGYFNNATCTWQEFPNWFNNASVGGYFHNPAVAVDASNVSQNVFVSNGIIYTKSGFGSCKLLTPPAGGNPGLRPSIASVGSGMNSGALAVWNNDLDIQWSFLKKGANTWSQPATITVPGGIDYNSDVGAQSGSHTMPVQ
jgi:hypothetical protein